MVKPCPVMDGKCLDHVGTNEQPFTALYILKHHKPPSNLVVYNHVFYCAQGVYEVETQEGHQRDVLCSTVSGPQLGQLTRLRVT